MFVLTLLAKDMQEISLPDSDCWKWNVGQVVEDSTSGGVLLWISQMVNCALRKSYSGWVWQTHPIQMYRNSNIMGDEFI